MKKQFLLFGLLVFALSAAHAQTDYVQVEVMSITPKADKLDLFKKGMTAHNKKYHSQDPYKVSVSYLVTGPQSGSYVWIMGPTTWTQMDSRPDKGEHNLDWEKNLTPYTESSGAVSYWRLNKDLSYQPEGSATFPKSRVRYIRVLPGQFDRYFEQMKKIVAVYKAKKYKSSFDLWEHVDVTDGPNVVTINAWANWAGRDSGNNFVKDFEEVHGAGSWMRYQQELDLCLDRSKTYDELMEAAPELGG
jgi:hypothetical protein